MDVWKLWWATSKARSLRASQSILGSFLRVFCSIKRYRMESNTFLPIWSVVAPENNTSIRHFRWATCWSPLSQEKAWNDVTNRARPRANLIDFPLGNVSNGGVFCQLWQFTRNRGFNQMKRALGRKAWCYLCLRLWPIILWVSVTCSNVFSGR